MQQARDAQAKAGGAKSANLGDQVRDWMAGQSWFDVVQHRLNPPLGVDMHWSRLVDAPIAAIMSVAQESSSTMSHSQCPAAATMGGKSISPAPAAVMG